jgi:Mn-dependent DtxR family transcriptional regulator
MVVFATLVFLLALFLSPSQGLLIKYLRRRENAGTHLQQDILKIIYKNCFDNEKNQILSGISINDISLWTGTDKSTIKKQMLKLKQKGLLNLSDENVSLTPEGEHYALRVLRSHRLWESYLLNEKVLDTANIHKEAEEYEHILTDEILDEIDKELGYPEQDPHGSPIPSGKRSKKE